MSIQVLLDGFMSHGAVHFPEIFNAPHS